MRWNVTGQSKLTDNECWQYSSGQHVTLLKLKVVMILFLFKSLVHSGILMYTFSVNDVERQINSNVLVSKKITKIIGRFELNLWERVHNVNRSQSLLKRFITLAIYALWLKEFTGKSSLTSELSLKISGFMQNIIWKELFMSLLWLVYKNMHPNFQLNSFTCLGFMVFVDELPNALLLTMVWSPWAKPCI